MFYTQWMALTLALLINLRPPPGHTQPPPHASSSHYQALNHISPTLLVINVLHKSRFATLPSRWNHLPPWLWPECLGRPLVKTSDWTIPFVNAHLGNRETTSASPREKVLFLYETGAFYQTCCTGPISSTGQTWHTICTDRKCGPLNLENTKVWKLEWTVGREFWCDRNALRTEQRTLYSMPYFLNKKKY